MAKESAADGSPVAALGLEELGARIAVVQRGDAALFKLSDLVLASGDIVVAVVDVANEDAVRDRFAAAHF